VQKRVVSSWRALLCCALAWTVALNGSVIVQLKVLEGEGSVYRVGTRSARGLTVLITDENGKPLDHASVSFRLPDEGPSGVFSSGLRTEVVTTGPDGHATVWGMQWNKIAGPVEIRITAVRDQARAGIVSTQYLSDSAAAKTAGGDGTFSAPHKSRSKWIIGAVVAGGAVAGLAFARGNSTTPAAATAASTGIQIGNPTITIGHP
jgi:hypothetical protein